MAATPDLYRPTIKPPAVTPVNSGSGSVLPRPRLSDPSLPPPTVPSFAQKVGQAVPGLILKGLGATPVARDIGAVLGVADKGVPVIKDVAYGLANPNTPLARPDFSDVAGGSSTTPIKAAPAAARVQGAAASAVGRGGSDPTNRILGTFTGKNGTQTITDAYKPPATGFGLSTVPAGASPMPDAVPNALARPGQGATIGQGAPTVDGSRLAAASGDRQQFASNIDDQIRLLGTPDRRSKRDLLASLLQMKGQTVAQGGQIATQLAGTELGSATDVATTGTREAGANYRSDSAQIGETFRMLNKPEYQADAAGAMNTISNGLARPVVDAAGKPLRTVTAQQEKAAERRQTVLKSFGDRAAENVPVGRQASYAEIQTARAQAAMTNGFKVIVDANGERMVNIDGEWVPL